MESNNAPQQQSEPSAPIQSSLAAAPVKSGGSGFAIAALVLGIIAFVFGWLGFLNLLTAILAVVFGTVALVKHQSKGMALTGLILGGIALVASAIFGIIWLAAANGASDTIKERSSNQTTTTPRGDKWDLQTAYDKIQTGMTKAQVEEATGKPSTGCVESQDTTFGKTETCNYGNVFTDGGDITVFYDNNGTVHDKTKYTNN